MTRLCIALCAGLFVTSSSGCSGSDPEPSNTPNPSTTNDSSSAGGGSSGGDTSVAGMTSVSTAGGGGTENGGGSSSGAGSSAGGSGGGSAGGTSTAPGTCVGKIENKKTACTAACFDYQCGVHKLGLKDCDCPAGVYECESCVYSGTEEIVQAPAEALGTCADTDVNLEESQTPCTKADRCYFYDAAGARDRLCACWDDGLGSTAWDCDTYPADWPKPG